MQDLHNVCNLHHRSQQRHKLNPLSKARDWTYILMDTSQVCYWATTGSSKRNFFKETVLCPDHSKVILKLQLALTTHSCGLGKKSFIILLLLTHLSCLPLSLLRQRLGLQCQCPYTSKWMDVGEWMNARTSRTPLTSIRMQDTCELSDGFAKWVHSIATLVIWI